MTQAAYFVLHSMTLSVPMQTPYARHNELLPAALFRDSNGLLQLHFNDLLSAARTQDSDQHFLLAARGLCHYHVGELDVVVGRLANFNELWQVEIILGISFRRQQADLPGVSIRSEALVLHPLDEGNGHVVRRGAQILVLLGGEDINANDMALCMAVLAGLGRSDLSHLAGVPLQHHVRTFAQLTRRLREGICRTGISSLEGRLVVRHGYQERGTLGPQRFKSPTTKA